MKNTLEVKGEAKIKRANSYSGMPIQETVSNGFFTVSEQWQVLSWNKAAERLLGIEAANIIGKNIWEEFVAVLPLNFYVVYQKAFLHDIPVHFVEYWPEMEAWFDVISYNTNHTLSVSFKKVGGTPQGRHADAPAQQLRVLNELYRYITEVTNDCLWEWDFKAKQLFWIDGSHKRVFGYEIENALIPQEFWESRIHADDRQRVLDSIQLFLTSASGTDWEVEYRFQRANSEYAYVCDRGHLMYDNTEKPVRMIGATQDISVRKITELQLLESEKNLSLIAKQMVNAVVTTDCAGKITWVNEAFTRITGYPQKEVMGKSPGSVLQGKDTDIETIKYLRDKIHALLAFDCNILNYHKSGRPFWMHLSGQPLFNEKGELERYFAMETDVTEKIENEKTETREREAKRREIGQAVLVAQEQERGNIGMELHDNLSQILGAAKLYLELAKNEEDDRQDYLAKANGYIVQVIQQIRTISKALVTPVLVLGLADSVKILVQDLKLTSKVVFAFVQDFDEETVSDQLQFDVFRIIQEQVNNILRHSGASHASISIFSKDKKLLLLVTDNGVGSNATDGSKGVGIINMKTRAGMHEGRVLIVTKPGEGFELQVIFPQKLGSQFP
jgi:PAS domain S-box-containing protein